MSSIKYRHLGRDSAHRKALLRNLVAALIERETISTSYAKAKEAQRRAEKLITLAKRNTEASRKRAHDFIYEPLKHFPKLFGPLRDRYLSRPGGYTRLLLSESHKSDQARSAMLTLVDGPKDIRFAMTAKEILRHRREGKEMWNEATAMHVRKVTRYRENGEELLEEEIARLEKAEEQVKRQEKEEYEREGTTFEWKEKLGPGTYERKKTKADAINYREKLERSQRQRGRSV